MRSIDLRASIRQEKPFRSEETELFLSFLFTVDRVKEIALAPLAEHRLSGEQYNVLRILRGAGPAGLPTYQVGERMVARAPNITRLVDKLERKGLLERVRSEEDRRVTLLRIVPAGVRLLLELDTPMLESTRHAMQGLSPEESAQLLDLLEKLRRPLRSANEQGEGGTKREE